MITNPPDPLFEALRDRLEVYDLATVSYASDTDHEHGTFDILLNHTNAVTLGDKNLMSFIIKLKYSDRNGKSIILKRIVISLLIVYLLPLGRTPFHSSREGIYPSGFGIACQKGSPLRHVINKWEVKFIIFLASYFPP